jgi:hypothetical protein
MSDRIRRGGLAGNLQSADRMMCSRIYGRLEHRGLAARVKFFGRERATHLQFTLDGMRLAKELVEGSVPAMHGKTRP